MVVSGRGQLFAVAAVAADPLDRRLVALLRDQVAGVSARSAANGSSLISDPATIGIVLVEQVDQAARQAGLGLAALAEEDDVLPGEDRVLDLRDDGLVVADDAREELIAPAHPGDQIGAHLFADRAGLVSGVTEFAEGGGPGLPRPLQGPRRPGRRRRSRVVILSDVHRVRLGEPLKNAGAMRGSGRDVRAWLMLHACADDGSRRAARGDDHLVARRCVRAEIVEDSLAFAQLDLGKPALAWQ